jgi:hypothetical protein
MRLAARLALSRTCGFRVVSQLGMTLGIVMAGDGNVEGRWE